MRTVLRAALALLAAMSASALLPAAESYLRELGKDPRSKEIRALAADSVKTKSGKVLTLNSLAIERDEAGVKTFLVTRGFLRAFKKDPDIEFPNDEFYSIVYLTDQEQAYIAKKLMEGLPKPAAPGKKSR